MASSPNSDTGRLDYEAERIAQNKKKVQEETEDPEEISYRVTLRRRTYETAHVYVTAVDENTAEEAAIDIANDGDVDWETDDVDDFEVDEIEED